MANALKTYKDVLLRGVVLIGAVFLLGGIMLYPLYSDLTSVEEKIRKTEVEIDRQRVFAPEYALMKERSEPGFEARYEIPKKEPITVAGLSEAAQRVGEFAEEAGLKVLDVVTSPSSLKEGEGKLMLQAMTAGNLSAFQKFYTRLGAWGAVARVSLVEVQAAPNDLEFYLEFWVYIEGSAG
jgi:hypothetical protein